MLCLQSKDPSLILHVLKRQGCYHFQEKIKWGLNKRRGKEG